MLLTKDAAGLQCLCSWTVGLRETALKGLIILVSDPNVLRLFVRKADALLPENHLSSAHLYELHFPVVMFQFGVSLRQIEIFEVPKSFVPYFK